MKRILPISLIVLIALQAFGLGLLYTFYAVQKDFVTESYCVNVERVEMLCSGKCYIAEVAQSIQSGNENTPDSTPTSLSVQLSSYLVQSVSVLPKIELQSHIQPNTAPFFLDRLSSRSVFQPPEVVI
ncbi:MAG: hypothetical protein AAGI23_11500 [Bacteroidota bacterium]